MDHLGAERVLQLVKKGFIGQVWKKILKIILKTSVSALVRENPMCCHKAPWNGKII